MSKKIYRVVAKGLLFAFCCGISSAIFAQGNFYIGLSAGGSLASIGDNQQIQYQDTIGNNWVDDYRPNNKHHAAFIGGFTGGYHIPLGQKFLLGLGISVEGLSHYSGKGQVWSTVGNVTDHTFNYSYNVESLRLMGDVILGFKLFPKIIPVVLVGVGTAWNHAYHYRNDGGGAYESSSFASHTEQNFAYEVGGGFGFAISPSNRISILYRYVDLGKAKFAARHDYHGQELPQPYGLSVGTIKGHDLVLNFVHLL